MFEIIYTLRFRYILEKLSCTKKHGVEFNQCTSKTDKLFSFN